jgi:hypothetical protein
MGARPKLPPSQHSTSTSISGGGSRCGGIEAHGRGWPVIKVRLVCDSCGGVIADGIGANQVRFQARALYRTREHKDFCLICAAHGREPPSAPQEAPGHAPVDPQTRAYQVEP